MLHLGRLRLLRELSERGTIAAVADALQFTPSAVSQQLAMLEREAGVSLLERAGRGVRLTDPALVLVDHAEALLERAAVAEADLASASGSVAGRARIAGFESVALKLAIPAMQRLSHEAPGLRCEFVEGEPEETLPALALGDVDLVIGDEWEYQPLRVPGGVERVELLRDPLLLVLPAGHPPARIADLKDEHWVTGPAGLGWDEMTVRLCRDLGGFEPDVAHRTNDATIATALVARGLGVTLLPELSLALYGGVAVHPIAERPMSRMLFAATRTTDAARPSTQAVLEAIRYAASAEAAASG